MKIVVTIRNIEIGIANEMEIFEWVGVACVIGRKGGNLTLHDDYTSVWHALFYVGKDGELRFRDLGSTNGSFVNGRRVTDCAVCLGDELRVGSTLICITEYDLASESQVVGADSNSA